MGRYGGADVSVRRWKGVDTAMGTEANGRFYVNKVKIRPRLDGTILKCVFNFAPEGRKSPKYASAENAQWGKRDSQTGISVS